ncbi:hypothetical protein [Rhizobium miluonense]|uniref:Uncharacterized protein n=1 Tax=Rhizobium miluonense TaxID=411945 RepID=A0A1C3XAV9_9HYPH|nr:hypothetical protein [Rhizobium miluonense]SCB49114.1 hypothetical protein GA0061102_107118 [Rhizobium miluonense]
MTKSGSAYRTVPRLGLNRAELALSIGVSTGTVDTMVEEGTLPPPRKWRSRKIWIFSEVEAAMLRWPVDGETVADGPHQDWDFDRDPEKVRNAAASKARKYSSPDREPETGAGGYPIISDPSSPIKQFYDQLGFDPWTMNEADMQRLQREADARWIAEIPGKPLTKRELNALANFAVHGPNVKVTSKETHCGPDTEERLKARGFLETFPSEKFPDQVGYYVLTEAGYREWESRR